MFTETSFRTDSFQDARSPARGTRQPRDGRLVPRQERLLEFEALVRQHLRVFVQPAIQREADLPRRGEYVGILDRGLVSDVIGTDRGIALHHVQRVAVEVACTVEPRLAIEL